MIELPRSLDFVRQNGAGALTTLRPDGSPHVSVVFAAPIDDRLWISSTQDRVKTRNVRRDDRVVFLAGIAQWVAIEGRARVLDGEDVLDRLRRYYRTARGEHPDWNEYDDAMIRERRVIIEVEPTWSYGTLP